MSRFHAMECERIESMLPLFVARELSHDENAAVSSHLDACERCREALAAFTALEAALVVRRDQVPAVDAFLPDVRAARAGWRSRTNVLVHCFRAATSIPGVAIVLVMWATLLLVRYNSRLTGDIANTNAFERMALLGKRGIEAMVTAAGGDAWTLTAVYGALAIGVIVSAGALTMRLVRD